MRWFRTGVTALALAGGLAVGSCSQHGPDLDRAFVREARVAAPHAGRSIDDRQLIRFGHLACEMKAQGWTDDDFVEQAMTSIDATDEGSVDRALEIAKILGIAQRYFCPK